MRKNLLTKGRFKAWEKKKVLWLKGLSFKKAIRLEESLISSSLIWEWRKNFPEDSPVCLKQILMKKA